MINPLRLGAYAEGEIGPTKLPANISAIQSAGWDTIMVSLFQVDPAGNISFNGQGLDPFWNDQLLHLKEGSTINTLLATFGGWDDTFANIQAIYQKNNHSFEGTPLADNCRAFCENFTAFDCIDIDAEYPPSGTMPANPDAVVAFCQLWINLGYGITFCPYQKDRKDFWAHALAALEQTNPGAVKWWNLQCYGGGTGNDPAHWVAAIKKVLPNFNTDDYILASNDTRYWDGQYQQWAGDCPATLQQFISQFKGQDCIGGAFVWNIDQILGYAAETNTHPDPDNCGNVGMADYVNALRNGLE